MDSLEKDKSIITTLDSLQKRFDQVLTIVDHWDADLMAVGVATPACPQRLVYFSTNNRLSGRYYVNLEWPAAPGSDLPYRQGATFDDVDFETLISILSRHLQLGRGNYSV